MRTRHLFRLLLIAASFSPVTNTLQAQRDVARNVDQALLLRGSGAVIAHREVKANHTCDLPTGPAQGNRFASTQEFRGTATSVTYAQRQGRSVGDVYRELEQLLVNSGIRVLFTCKDGKCGRGPGADNWCNPAWQGTNGQRHLTGVVTGTNSVAIISLHVQAPTDPERAVAHLTLIEVENPSGAGLGAGVGARAPVTTFSSATLLRTGRTTLPEPLFQRGSDELRSDAARVLGDIAQFLKQNPGTRLVVVNGSRTGSGVLRDFALSHDRAEAIVNALIKNYDIAENRVRAEATSKMDETRGGDSQTTLVLVR